MKITKSVQRIGWRFSQGKPFQPNQNDIEAYNDIVDYVGINQKETIVDNVLFTKMYIYLLGEFLNYYGTTVNDPILQKELHKILDSDMSSLIEQFRSKANHQELNTIKTVEDLENFKAMTFQECVDNLKIMTTEAINQFSPKHLNRV